MSYADNIAKDNIEVNYFVRLGSRFQITSGASWTNLTGSPVSKDWDDRPIGKLIYSVPVSGSFRQEATEFYEAPSLADVLSDDFVNNNTDGNARLGLFYDSLAKKLYFNGTATTADLLGTSQRFYGERFYYFSTRGVGFHSKPDDDRYPNVDYQGTIVNLPTISSSVNQVFYGYSPSRSGSITIANDNGYLDEDFFEGSLSNCTFEIYRCVGELLAENTERVFRGFTKKATVSKRNVTIEYIEASSLLDNYFQVGRWTSFESPGDPTGVNEPSIRGAVQRGYLCGKKDRQNGSCILTYVPQDTATTSDNRAWGFGFYFPVLKNVYGSTTDVDRMEYLVDPALVGSNTGTRTYLLSVAYLNVDDFISNNTGDVTQVTAIGANYIDHISVSPTMTTGGIFRKSPFKTITIQDKTSGTVYPVTANEILDIGYNSQNIAVQFKTTVEASLGIAGTLSPETHLVYADLEVGLPTTTFIDTGSRLGSVNPLTGRNENPVNLIYLLLKSAGFYRYTDFDEDSFVAAANAADVYIAGVSPEGFTDTQAETYRAIVAKVCEAALLRVYMKNGKWFVSYVAPFGSSVASFDGIDIQQEFTYKIDCEEIAKDVTVRYRSADITLVKTLSNAESYYSTTTQNPLAQARNDFNNQIVKSLMLYYEADAETMRDRYAYLFSEPFRTLMLRLSLRGIDVKVGDTVTISSEEFRDAPFSGEKQFSVISIDEGDNDIALELFDQSGIETNAGSW